MSDRPKPCSQCEPYAGNWRMASMGLARCLCPRGRSFTVPPQEIFTPRISAKAAGQAVRALQALPFFPADESAQTLIADEVLALCESVDQARWIVRRMLRLYAKWPGVREMRLVFCSRHRPLDGQDSIGMSEVYPDGIPLETPAVALQLPPGPQMQATRRIEAALSALVPAKTMQPAKRERRPQPPINANFKPITEADIERAIQENRERSEAQ